ncbi:probable bifunctional dTTP/UTP pyrophosphatase/methyltransferase protein isoform X2 [Rousettus aegyptiacus]|uniref:Acetylserotonin O-methyltransferase like n=2 Tax=Rousettus aegyptiacus TaxID=9407 RepID=A0A7J8B826_ROUAE|nr:probable bifunctional dTTP/UTP pyrophosphatase/methyltransferase protein isoform X2 [Rousettus aegyptiacus]KAF6394661.1 acetylserotonin O-methyltransferase like [Rousettus aegyptiacus]
MMYPVIRRLLHKRVVLASASPRRQEILSNAGLKFEVVPSQFKETLTKASFPTPSAYAVETAKQKALEVAHRIYQKDLRAPDIVIGADTIVVIEGLILEKPVDRQDAYSMLCRLNGKEHSVFTGVAIVHCSSQDGRLHVDVSEFHEETAVTFSQLSDELLWDYVDSGEPMDKAGGYGIQALGSVLVEQVRGDVLNVVGFPLNHFCRKMAELHGPPRPAHRPQAQRDSAPTTDTSESLSDVAPGGAGSHRARSDEGRGHGRAQGGAQGRGHPGSRDADCDLPPFPTGLLELIDGFKASKALFTACKLKVFDLLDDEGPLRAVDVASKLDISECGAGRLLDVCVALGLLDKTDRGYRNTELAGLHLLSRGEHSLHSLALHCDDHAWPHVAGLDRALRPGAAAACSQPASGAEAGAACPDCSQSPDTKLWFSGATHGLARLTARQVATAFDLSRFSSACDLGGCLGALAPELARAHPGLRVTVFDLPEAAEHVACLRSTGRRTEQVRFVPGDFLKDRLPEADLYIACGLLRGRPDDGALLSRIAGSCPPGGGLLLVELALHEDAREARPGLRRALHCLLHPRGPERGLSHHRRLLERLGFADVRVAHTSDVLDVVLATRAAP